MIKNRWCVFFLFSLLTLLGCDNCRNLDCIYDEPFVFRLTDNNGLNLLDAKTITLTQVSIYNPGNRSDSLYLSAFQLSNETWIEARLKRNQSEYTLQVQGAKTVDLKFDLESSKTKCCGTITTIKGTYVDGDPSSEVAYRGWSIAVL